MLETEPPSLFINAIFAFTSYDFGELFLLLILLFLSALLSGSEVAFFSIKKKDLVQAKEEGKDVSAVENLLKDKQKLLANILIGNNFINIGIVLLSAILSEVFVHPYIGDLNLMGISFKILFDVVIITFLLLLFGEIIPKIYSNQAPLKFGAFTAPLINFFGIIAKPISIPLLWLSSLIEKNLKNEHKISVDQLSQALEMTSEDEMTTNEEQRILEGIVNFGNTETREVMTPRVDMFSMRLENNFQEVLQKISQKGFSRVPVYEDDIDEIKGLLYAKDLLPYLDRENFDWHTVLRKPFFVPENKKLDDLLSDFQEKKIHIAIVVDEYGGTSGIVSMEDILEEVVGDISDEFDDENIFYSKLDKDNYLFEGKTSLKDFMRIMEIDDDTFDDVKGEAETLAGLILEINEETPNRRQKIHYKNFIFTIESIDKRRIKRIKVTRTPLPEEEKNEEQ
ncbi:gliding motility-associated protein GldE [Ornithobacterium rhinotracheale]|uniref:gliding motility-associated protein GldE n=1 Tax=Ornithobacterium rhinotracheale TaxID=28251 RepID=UPI00129CC770|nr:gliding motility-associated protein GldE [Ornithobacterium rhinotracheale]MRJ08928.1 gliding motility-associated protein GldE [Ornithobacterium rhinotracheale]MRJ10555.1 gliding motility-associated protein GldE [Ornithobacterium rhinotracheale]UOH78827.1 gliding motility-associated protein GldE [Ornithobacterium rhinotracheale]